MDFDREETLRKKAYEKWEAEGRPEGEHEKHWRDAESEFSTADDEELKKDRGIVKNEEPQSSTDASRNEDEVPKRPLSQELMPIGDPAGAA